MVYCLLFAMLMIPCDKCSHFINEKDTYYEKKLAADMKIITHMGIPGFNDFHSLQDIICRWCYRLLPHYQQDFYKKMELKND